MIYDKPDPNHYIDLGDCPNCRHGIMWMSHGSIENPHESYMVCFYCGYKENEKRNRI